MAVRWQLVMGNEMSSLYAGQAAENPVNFDRPGEHGLPQGEDGEGSREECRFPVPSYP